MQKNIFVALLLCMCALSVLNASETHEKNFVSHSAYVQNKQMQDSKLHLQKSYPISKSDIYSTDMFPTLKHSFKIATLPPEKFTLKLKAADIQLLFARWGYEISSFEDTFVEFYYTSDIREKHIVDFIQKAYMQHYGENLHIDTVIVRPVNQLPAMYEVIEYDMADSMMKKNSGTISVRYRVQNSSQIKKSTFIYMIRAKLDVIKATRNIPANDALSAENTYEESIIFGRTNATYITSSEITNLSAKSYINANSVITRDKTKPKVIVKKGDRIHVSGYENGVSMEIILEARQNAIYNEIINAQNPSSGKIIRVRIIAEGKGELL